MNIEKHDWMIGASVLLIVIGMALWFMPSASNLTAPGPFTKETAETAVMSVDSSASSGGGMGGGHNVVDAAEQQLTDEINQQTTGDQCLFDGGGGLNPIVDEYEEF
jgi:hypothetical protein